MRQDRKIQAEPLCKFGPGGDFVAAWEPEPSERMEALARLLSSAAKALAAALGLKRTGANAPSRSNFRPNGPTICYMEKSNDAIENNTERDTTYAASAPAFANDSAFSAELLLFPDLVRNGIRIKHKPKHRIRASHRAAKKGSAFRIPKQGSLFEGQFARAGIA